jgi:hypothetical protein
MPACERTNLQYSNGYDLAVASVAPKRIVTLFSRRMFDFKNFFPTASTNRHSDW